MSDMRYSVMMVIAWKIPKVHKLSIETSLIPDYNKIYDNFSLLYDLNHTIVYKLIVLGGTGLCLQVYLT